MMMQQRKSKVFAIRLTLSELKRLKRTALRKRKQPTVFAREAVMGEVARQEASAA